MADSSNNPKPFSMAANVRNTYKYEGIPLHSFVTPDDMKAIRSMEVREDDVIITTYPKCGTHWMVEIILLAENSGIPLTSQERITQKAIGLLELPMFHRNGAKAYDVLAESPSPRLYITHLPIQFLPEQIWEKKPKIVYVARNPRDCLVSFYNFALADPQPFSWQEAFDNFLSEDAAVYGSVWDHQYGFWKHRNDDNFLYLTFENMKQDPAGNVARVAAHLGYDLSAEQVAEVTRLSSITEMKATYARLEEELDQIGKYITRAGGILPFLHKGNQGSKGCERSPPRTCRSFPQSRRPRLEPYTYLRKSVLENEKSSKRWHRS